MRNRVVLLISLFCLGVGYLVSIPDNKVRMVFCDVGQGDGAVIMQGDNQVIIDVGPDNRKMLDCLGEHLPFWDKKIEAVIITHSDDDHDGGLGKVMEAYRVENTYRDLRWGDVVRLEDINFEVLSPWEITGDDNTDSVVGVVNKKVLMLADAPVEVDQKLVWRGIISGKFEVVKVSHHGSRGGTSKELIEAVKPTMAIVSVGAKNKFGHPTKELLDRLVGVDIKRTDVDGDIIVVLQ